MKVGSIVVFVGNLKEANDEAKAAGKPLIVKDHPYEVVYIGKFSPTQRLKMAMVRWYVLFDEYIIVDLYPGVALNPEDWKEILPPDPITVEDIIEKENWEHDQGKLIQDQAINNPL